MYDTRHFEELQGRLRALLVMVGHQLPPVTVELVSEMIDANECGVALEVISDMLVEARAAIGLTVLTDVAELVQEMDLPGETVERLRPLVTDERDDSLR